MINEPRNVNHPNFEHETVTTPHFGRQSIIVQGSSPSVVEQGTGFSVSELVPASGPGFVSIIIVKGGLGHYHVLSPQGARSTAAALIQLADEIDAGRAGGRDA